MQILSGILMCCVLIFSTGCAKSYRGEEYAPRAADKIAMELDAQIMQRGGLASSGGLTARSTDVSMNRSSLQAELRQSITVMATVPVNINNLEISSPLARQMSEEITRWLVSRGYRFQEIRKGKEIFFQKKQGEMLLTRNTKLLANRRVTSIAVLAGTYLITPEQVRFSMRLIHTPSNEVLAMATATVPITPDVVPLLDDTLREPVKVTPSVNTRL